MPVETANDPPVFGNLAREMSKILDRMSRPYSKFGSDAWQPNVNLYETDRAYLVCVDLAGVDKNEVDLHVVDNRLVLRGRRETPRCPADITECDAKLHQHAKIHLMEIDHGRFARDVELPDNIHTDDIRANYANGMLWIEIPKK